MRTHTAKWREDIDHKADTLFWHLVGILKDETNGLSEDDAVTEAVYNRVFEMFQEGRV